MNNPKISTFQFHPFEHFINQIGLAADENLYYVALLSALALPDICGALESNDGKASGQKYKQWFDKWVAPKYQINGQNSLSGNDCYMLRCASIHQGRLTHENMSFDGVIFVEPGSSKITLHNNMLDKYLNIDVKVFCIDIVQSSHDWFLASQNTQNFIKNFDKSMRWHPFGFGPISGLPVIA